MLPDTHVALPTFESQLKAIAAAEQGEGWLCVCDDAGRFLLLNRELVESLAVLLRSLTPVDHAALEVCAGRGELAQTLRSAGARVVATDADPPVGSPVVRASALEALRRYRPVIVLGCFVPIDAGVDELVMGFPTVRHYVVLGARLGGLFTSRDLWQAPGWTAEPLDGVTRWMLTRHDVWLGTPRQPILRHGEAWHFSRNERSDGDETIFDR